MDTVWTIMTGIAYGFEFFGFGIIVVWAALMIFEGDNKRIDKIRKYILMQDEEEL